MILSFPQTLGQVKRLTGSTVLHRAPELCSSDFSSDVKKKPQACIRCHCSSDSGRKWGLISNIDWCCCVVGGFTVTLNHHHIIKVQVFIRTLLCDTAEGNVHVPFFCYVFLASLFCPVCHSFYCLTFQSEDKIPTTRLQKLPKHQQLITCLTGRGGTVRSDHDWG